MAPDGNGGGIMVRTDCGLGTGWRAAIVALLLLSACSGKDAADVTESADLGANETQDQTTVPDAPFMDGTLTDAPPADAPPADVPPVDVPPQDVPPADLPPEDVPPADAPPADVPPEDVPPADVPPEDLPPCEFPPFPSDCSLVSEFQCGFMAKCEAGALIADWHHHYFCSQEETIIDYNCSYSCPHGCQEGEIMDWPQNGQLLVDSWCSQCSGPADCDGLAHDPCEGSWTCQAGQCDWVCGPGCVPEGESAPVVPGAPECCKGLAKIPCDKPDADGNCQLCTGASVCAACGDGTCGKGENQCNCPKDCQGACLGLGQGFIDFDTEGKCCPGLTPKFDCDLQPDGCLCKKCPCNICVPCGDGVCGPFEHQCNCPEDCPTTEKCVATTQTECLGEMPEPSNGTLEVAVMGNNLHVAHLGMVMNCCAKVEICFEPFVGTVAVAEKLVQPYAPCFCTCKFDIEATLPGIKSGSYSLTLFNEEMGQTLFTQDVIIP